MRDWLVLLAVGAGTYLMRVAFLLSHRAAALAAVRRTLPHIGPAVLGALVLPALILPSGSLSLHATAPTLIAAAACVLAWRRTRSTPLALVVGLVTAWTAEAALWAWT
ncbi:AzlD domain-containing protein [Acrocarpospora catenulata]|uniref:AzlD domain-containing protein n=1 Tax=Acrocarpospora catenulata TaxID=2836182 RepID=UPI001BDAFDDC|nr:AzlD domain-containing protein [Acrocarpospora catenulata]